MAEQLTRKAQFLCELETTSGTAETLVAADAVQIKTGAAVTYDAPKEKLEIAKATLTQSGSLSSTKAIPMAISVYANTPDTITDPLNFADPLVAAGFGLTALRRIPIGAITGGPIARGATMTGGTSAATGRVVRPAANGATHIYFMVISGTFQAESLTFTGGASATSSAISAAWGWSARPISTGFQTATARYEEDGYQWTARGAMANFTAEFNASKAGVFEFAFNGPKEDYGDQALTSGVSFGTEDPPILQTAGLLLDTFTPVFRSVKIDMKNNVVLREDGNADDSGFKTARLRAREPEMVIVLEHELAAAYDFFTKYDENTKVAIGFSCGTVAGKIVAVYADYAQMGTPGMEDENGIRNLSLPFALTGTSDDELEILFI